ncbi:SHOCT domain-containing protein [Halorarum halophilum]|uniref:SHOCT domain-containing protein n=1 Tax=Halorarum halophilum TaxID=2743090 RepID=A0A7D5K892_9EURY|nr:SHOCT domain-containing protein [Halobaculum halophilum]QLG28014.1 SHOCT domain-containing protein [Halobaculum halophilum]
MANYETGESIVRIVLVVLAVLLLAPLLLMAVAMPMMGMMGWGWGGLPGGLSPLWGVGMLLLWLVVLLGVGVALYRAFASRGGTGRPDPALEELRTAYARGDLTDEEYEERRATLRSEE